MMKQRQKSTRWQTYKQLDKESGSDDETELFIRNKTPRRELPTIEKNIEESDTLQSIAIRYHCTIEDLKRLNNIHKENEIFAKRTIKVPLRPVTTALAEVHVSGKSSPNESLPSTSKEDLSTFNNKLQSLLNIPNGKQATDVNFIIFNTNITQKPVERIGDHSFEELDEEVCLLPHHEQKVVAGTEPAALVKLNCSGADFDISWITLVFCIVIVILAAPVIYVFYIAEHPEQYHHQHVV